MCFYSKRTEVEDWESFVIETYCGYLLLYFFLVFILSLSLFLSIHFFIYIILAFMMDSLCNQLLYIPINVAVVIHIKDSAFLKFMQLKWLRFWKSVFYENIKKHTKNEYSVCQHIDAVQKKPLDTFYFTKSPNTNIDFVFLWKLFLSIKKRNKSL